MSKQKIALFGGSFDPVHQGHLAVATYAQQVVNLDQVIFIPCAQSPHKLEKKYTAHEHRTAMLKLATQDLSWAQVSEYELTAPQPSYSLNTIEHFKSQYPLADLYWIMGEDQWRNISSWHEYVRVLKLVTIIVYPRKQSSEKINLTHAQTKILAHKNLGIDDNCIYLDQASYLPISSTLIREKTATSTENLHPQVLKYALNHQLYL